MGAGAYRFNKIHPAETRKGSLLSADERREALRLRRLRMSVQGIARALGRSVPDVATFLQSPEAEHG